MTAKLKITLLGSIRVQAGEQFIEQYRSESARALLFYLALTPAGPQQRSVLATLFWPDAPEKQARINLRQTLTRLRQAFNTVDPTLSKQLLTTTHKTITLQNELIRCDAVELQGHLTTVANHAHQDLYTCPVCWEQLQQAAHLFQGEFLNGFHLAGNTPYNDWQNGLRDRYHLQILLALDTLLVMAHQRGELALVQQFAQQQLALEPWREEGQRHLIWALTQLGKTEAAIRQYEQLKVLLETEFGLQPEAETTALYRQIRSATELELPNPYRGLQPFTAAHAPFFYGRERHIMRLKLLLQEQNFLVVIGPSGSGKSSLVAGGVLPRLQAPTSDDRWVIAQSRPGKRPFHNLSTALKSLFPTHQQERLAELSLGKVSLTELAEQLLQTLQQNETNNEAPVSPRERQHPSRLLLYIDQFEELFTLVTRKKTADRFIDQLLEAQASSLPITIMLTMRADFMAEALAYPKLAEITQQGLFLLGGMASDEMQQAITQPAQKLNITFEPGLVARLLHDVGQEPGQLPLLQFALTELWERRNLGQLTHAAYDAIGGLSGAMANYADSIYEKLTQREKTEFRRLFFQLVRPGEQAADTRQVISSNHLSSHQWQLVQRLVETRLVVTDQEPSGSYTVELVHEALIQYWERLHEWLQTDRTFRLWYHRVQTAVRHWEQLAEDEGALLRGQPLAEAEIWFQEREGDIGEGTKQFILASIGLRQRREAAAAAQRERERAFTLALQAQLALQQGETVQARALALDANEISDPPTAAQLLLSEAAYVPSTRWRTDTHTASVLDIAASPDQKTFLSAGAEGVVHWCKLETGICLTSFTPHQTAVHCVAFSPDGQTAVSGDSNGQLFWWQLETGNILQQIHAHEGTIWDVAFLPDGEAVLTAGADKVIRRWQLETGSLEQTYTQHRGGVTCLAVHTNGRLALSGSEDQSLILWKIDSGQVVRQMGHTDKHIAQQVVKRGHVGTVWGVAFHPKEESAISVAMDRNVIIWDLAEGRVSNYFQFDVSLLDLDISPDGSYALLASLSSQVCLYDLQRNQIVRRLQEHQQRVQAVCFAGQSMALSGSGRGGLRLWTLHNGAEERAWRSHDGDILSGFALSPDGRTAIGGFVSGQACLWDVASSEILRRWQAHGDAIIRNCHFGPNGRFVVTGCGDIYREAKETTVKVWEVATGELQYCFDNHTRHVWDVAFSPNGRFVLSTAHDGTVRYGCLVSGSSRLLLDTTPQAALGVDISPDGRFAVLGLGKGTSTEPDYAVLIVAVETGEIIHRLRGHSEAIYTVRFGPNGRYVLSGAHDNKVILWDAISGEKVRELIGHRSVPCTLDFHPTKPFAVSGAAESKVILWDLTQGVELRRWDGHDNLVRGVNFTPSGNHVVSGSSDNIVRVWRFDETKEDVLHWLEHERHNDGEERRSDKFQYPSSASF
ncbi:MAG: BTAD domain-containing putative transcriptional regulator [Chloroflexota bacterium]